MHDTEWSEEEEEAGRRSILRCVCDTREVSFFLGLRPRNLFPGTALFNNISQLKISEEMQ